MNLRQLIFQLLLGFVFLITACQTPTNDQAKKKGKDVSKPFPAEDYFLQRAYPNKDFPIKAYVNSLKEASALAKVKSIVPTGFDADWVTQGPGNAGARVNSLLVNPDNEDIVYAGYSTCLLYTSPSPRDATLSRMPSSA